MSESRFAYSLLSSSVAATSALGATTTKTVIGKPISGDYRIDALLESSTHRWNAHGALGSPVEVTFSFMSEKPAYGGTDSEDATGFQPFHDEQKAAVRDIFSKLGKQLNITFKEVLDLGSSYGQIRFGNNTQTSSSGYAFLPHADSSDIAGDVWINLEYASSMRPGTFNYATLLHEIGHALGLKHPGNYNAVESETADPDATYLGSSEDNQDFTLMSYEDAPNSLGQQRVWYGMYDMLALQYLYGAKAFNTGDADVYRFTDASGRELAMIQDSAGTQDTIDLSAVTTSAFFDMSEGRFSSVGAGLGPLKARSTVSIMFGTVIENIVGTPSSDFIIGNAANNRMTGGGGSDTLDGDEGVDTAVFVGNWKDWTINIGAFRTTVTKGSTTVSLDYIERAEFADMTVNLAAAAKARSISPDQLKSIEELYIAYFNRIPDADGLSYWADQIKAGKPIAEVGESFYDAAVQYSSLTGYSTSMSNADFVRVIYKNVLGRTGATAPADTEVDYWAGEIVKGNATRGSLISTMLDSAHSFKGNATWGWVADLLDNKVTVANYFAVDNGLNYNTAEDSISKGMAIAAAITADSTDAAVQLIGLPA